MLLGQSSLIKEIGVNYANQGLAVTVHAITYGHMILETFLPRTYPRIHKHIKVGNVVVFLRQRTSAINNVSGKRLAEDLCL